MILFSTDRLRHDLMWRRLTCAAVGLTVVATLIATPVAAKVTERSGQTTASATSGPRLRDRARTTRPNPDVVLRGSGWGHSVGMSQYGAYAMAQAGKTYREILRHYYRGVRVDSEVMPGRIRVGLAYAGTTVGVVRVTAVRNSIPWIVCKSGCTDPVRVQPEGVTWKAKRLDDGRWRLLHGDKRIWTGGAGKRLVADFNPRNARNAIIRAVNPNGGTARYRYGRLEIRRAPTSSRIWVVLDIRSVEKYLRGLGEVPNSWGHLGAAALRAQAVAARTYAVRNHLDRDRGQASNCACSVVATPSDQVYSGYEKELQLDADLWRNAVDATAGVVVTYDGKLIETFYSSSHGGRSENIQDSYAFAATTATHPYLRSVPDPWSLDPRAGNPLAHWRRRVSNASIASFVGLHRVRRVSFDGRTDGGSPRTLVAMGQASDGSWRRRSRTGDKGIVGIALKSRYSYPERGLSTLPTQQIRKIGFAPFSDDDGRKYEYAVVYSVRADLMDKVSAMTFGVGRKITRAQMANALYRMLVIQAPSRNHFSDVAGHRYAEAINAVYEAGIIAGKGEGTFEPEGIVTRGRAAVYLRRALKLRPLSQNLFDDDDGLATEPSINRIAAKGLMSGCGQRRFCPGRPVLRENLAQILYRSVSMLR